MCEQMDCMKTRNPYPLFSHPRSFYFMTGLLCLLVLAFSVAAEELQIPPRDMVLVIDNSGSMKKNDPLFLARDFVRNFIDNQEKNARFGMVLFDETARLLEPLSTAAEGSARYRMLRSLESVDYKGQWTDIPAGIERAVYELKTHGRENAFQAIIFITDGIVDTGNRERDIEKEKWLKESLTAECRKEQIRIIGIAFTENADFSLIQTLALETNGEYFRAANLGEIPAIFNSIQNLIRKSSDAMTSDAQIAGTTAPTPSPPAAATTAPQPVKEKKIAPTVNAQRLPPQKIPEKEFAIGLLVVIIAVLAFLILSAVALYLFRRRPAPEEFADAQTQEEDDPPTVIANVTQAMLIDAKNVTSKKTFPLTKDVTNIGRGQTNDVTIPLKNVSGFHATIEHNDGAYFLIDQRSRNKTLLNDVELAPFTPARLKSGDEITFTDNRFIFLIANQIPSGDTTVWRDF
jgi:hypothetical protein